MEFSIKELLTLAIAGVTLVFAVAVGAQGGDGGILAGSKS
jgi:hypothetical protein